MSFVLAHPIKKIMLIDLSKEEMKTIVEALQFQMVEAESLDDFDDKLNEEVGFKLIQLLKVCTCKEDSNDWTNWRYEGSILYSFWKEPFSRRYDWWFYCWLWKGSSKTWDYSWLLPSGVCLMQLLTLLSILIICGIILGVFLLNLYNPH